MVKALLEKNETSTLLNGFLEDFQNCVNRSVEPTVAQFEKCLDSHFKISSNGKVLSNNLAGYLEQIKDFQNRYSHCEIHLSKEEIVCGDNALACYYQADLTTKKGQKHKIYMMVIATIEHDRLVNWKQVTHENGTEHWVK